MYGLRLNSIHSRSHKAKVITILLQHTLHTSAGQHARHNERQIKNTFAAALNFTSKTAYEKGGG